MTDIVEAKPYPLKERLDLYQLELAKDAPIPGLCSRVTFQGRLFNVFGLLDYGDGHGPILLGIPLDQSALEDTEGNEGQS